MLRVRYIFRLELSRIRAETLAGRGLSSEPFDLSCRVIGLQRNRCVGRSVGEARCILWLWYGPQRSASFAGQWLVGGQATTGNT